MHQRSNPLVAEAVVASDRDGPAWQAQFAEIKDRLRRSVTQAPTAREGAANGHAEAVQADLLACVAALDALQATLGREMDGHQQLALAVFDAQTALAQTRAELAGTRVREKRARHQAQHDSLTTLPNRRFLRERLDQAMSQWVGPVLPAAPARPVLALLYLDLDGFKAINDLHGHDVGDEVLRIVAARLSRAVRAGDMVSRLGGDEFACLLGGALSPARLTQLASKLFHVVSAPMKVGDVGISVLASIGIAVCPQDGSSAAALLKSADAAMYRAKRQRSQFAFFALPGATG